MRSSMVKDEEGNVCSFSEKQQGRWRRHFTKILNIQSEFSVGKVKQRPIRTEMEELPSVEELYSAVGRIGNGKAASESDILPEMLKAACSQGEFLNRLLELVHDVWREGHVPNDWWDAILIPIFKKDDLINCDNWRGICLLGKLWLELYIPESQCDFRKSRSCTNMIFIVRKLIEKHRRWKGGG